MDLLGDLGREDQLTSARAENAVLMKKVKELTKKINILQVENQSLLAEVEMYRKEHALPTFSKMALGASTDERMVTMDTDNDTDHFVRSGNGIFPSQPAVTLEQLHGLSTPLCCALSRDDVVLATGGADGTLVLVRWGAALAPLPNAAAQVVHSATRIPCAAPVICVAFSPLHNLVSAACMDGSIRVFAYTDTAGLELEPINVSLKMQKYVKSMAWCPSTSDEYPMLAIASADGTVVMSQVISSQLTTVKTLHLPGNVETLCFSKDGIILYSYTRGTPYLSAFCLDKDYEQIKLNLNNSGASGGFEDHVSFCVMDMSISPNGTYIALATDASRNIVLEAATGKQVRNLYGHSNDEFAQPKIAWSKNGDYLFGNTQEDSSVCVWDVASSSIVKRLEGHAQPIRALYSSTQSDSLVTTSFDKTTKIWLTPTEEY